MDYPKRIIFWLYASLTIIVPLILWPYTSEVFEFNKLVVTYICTILVVCTWIARMIIERKFIYRRTILDIPLLIFLGSQAISTLLSIDTYTSLYGYYSRFNGGLFSLISYSLLYLAFVSNFEKKEALKLIKIMLGTSVVVCIYGVLEHFGIDKDIWVQDVQSRVFSTLGQPNWLAAYVVALLPLSWALALKEKFKSPNFLLYYLVSILLFWVLIFTKSRSGFLAAILAAVLFFVLTFSKNFTKSKKTIGAVFLFLAGPLIICAISGTQWTPSVYSLLSKPKTEIAKPATGTALESGGTESGVIRQIVWKGAWQMFLHYPVFGTGVETFAYSYYLFRPVEHNLTSEWDFIYNKAHNEFLNFAATTGGVGIITYLILLATAAYAIFKSRDRDDYLSEGLLCGFLSLSVGNFFGFSVVPTQIQLFLFPPLAFTLSLNESSRDSKDSIGSGAKTALCFVLLAGVYLVYLTSKYWYSDLLYARAKAQNSFGRPDLAAGLLTTAIKNEPRQAIYYGELASSYSTVAMAYEQEKDATKSAQVAGIAAGTIEHAVSLAPANVNIRRQMFGIYVRLSTINQEYLLKGRNSLKDTIKLAPTDAKLYFNLGIADANLGLMQEAASDLKMATELKPNYADARIEYAAVLVHLDQKEDAKRQLKYVLEKIDPGNETAKQALANIN